jgi:hypothetical protein
MKNKKKQRGAIVKAKAKGFAFKLLRFVFEVREKEKARSIAR